MYQPSYRSGSPPQNQFQSYFSASPQLVQKIQFSHGELSQSLGGSPNKKSPNNFQSQSPYPQSQGSPIQSRANISSPYLQNEQLSFSQGIHSPQQQTTNSLLYDSSPKHLNNEFQVSTVSTQGMTQLSSKSSPTSQGITFQNQVKAMTPSQQSSVNTANFERQLMKINEELSKSKQICLNTQKYNEELVSKIKVLIKENEKFHQKEQEFEEKRIEQNPQIQKSSIQFLLLENKYLQGRIRDLESQVQILTLDNERFQFALNQLSNGRTILSKEGEESINNFQEKCQVQSKQIEIQDQQLKIQLDSIFEYEKKLDLIGNENLKLEREIQDKTKQLEVRENDEANNCASERFNKKQQHQLEKNPLISENQFEEIEKKITSILEENIKLGQLLQKKSEELEGFKQYPKQQQQENENKMEELKKQLKEQEESKQSEIANLKMIIEKLTSNQQPHKTQEQIQIDSALRVELSLQAFRLTEYEKARACEKEQMNKQIKDVKGVLERSSLKINKLQSEVEEKAKMIEQKGTEMKGLREIIKDGETKLREYKSQLEQTKNKLLEKDIEATQKQSATQYLENQINFLIKEKETQKNEISQLSSLLTARKDQFEETCKSLNEIKSTLEGTIAINMTLQKQNLEASNEEQKQVLKIRGLETKVYEQYQLIQSYERSQSKDKSSNSVIQQQSDVLKRLLQLERDLQKKLFTSFESIQKK